jgi:hypothetical protein
LNHRRYAPHICLPKNPENPMRFTAFRSEAFWLLPFLFLAAATLSLLRPWPAIPPTAGGGRVIMDGNLREVEVPVAPKIVSNQWTNDFLQKTHAIDVLINAGEPRERPQPGESLLTRIYPRLAEDASLWDFPTKIESVVAYDAGYVYLGGGDHYEDFGLLSINAHPPEFHDKDNVIFSPDPRLERSARPARTGRHTHAPLHP